MRLELKCKCGATAVFKDGFWEAFGAACRKADEWLDRHGHCLIIHLGQHIGGIEDTTELHMPGVPYTDTGEVKDNA
jgi:hypothetical protein